MNKQDFFAHFPDVSDELRQYAIDDPLLASRYLFVRREKKAQMAYCTHCRAEYTVEVEGALHKHNEETVCAKCGSDVKLKSSGIGRKRLIDQAYIVWYEKSVVNPALIVATWYLATRDYSGDYRQVKTEFTPRARYIFEPRHGATMYRLTERWSWQEKVTYTEWVEQKTIAPLPVYTGGGYFQPRIESFVSYESIENAVKGTYFDYLPWQEYGEDWKDNGQSWSLIEFFALASKYPCVEYLAKMGLKKIISAKMHGQKTYGAIYWRGKSIEKVLRMGKQDLHDLRPMVSEITPLTLHSFQYWRKKRGWEISLQEARILQGLADESPSGYYRRMLDEHVKYASEEEIVKYLLKQAKRPDALERYQSITTVLSEWRDYLNECAELGMDLTYEHVLFPNNLHASHEKTMRKVRIKRDENLNSLIAVRLNELVQFVFADGQFLIRPANDSIELFAEGKELHHCVGGYADRYAAGKTDIYLVRSADKPDTPFVTVEVVDGQIKQARGNKNCTPSNEVQTFLTMFIKNMRKVKQRTNKEAKNKIAV